MGSFGGRGFGEPKETPETYEYAYTVTIQYADGMGIVATRTVSDVYQALGWETAADRQTGIIGEVHDTLDLKRGAWFAVTAFWAEPNVRAKDQVQGQHKTTTR